MGWSAVTDGDPVLTIFFSQWSNIGQQSSGESVLCEFGTIYGVRVHGI